MRECYCRVRHRLRVPGAVTPDPVSGAIAAVAVTVSPNS